MIEMRWKQVGMDEAPPYAICQQGQRTNEYWVLQYRYAQKISSSLSQMSDWQDVPFEMDDAASTYHNPKDIL